MPEPSSSPHRWNQIKRLPLLPQIQTLDQYEEAVSLGIDAALTFLRSTEILEQLSVGDLQTVHFHLFKEVHPWAGQFRAPGQLAVVSGYPAADTSRIQRELELALHQTRHLLAEAFGDDLRLLAALSFFHVRFERIHPFQDGNGRSGRTVLAVQFERLFGRLPEFSDQRGYREALRASTSGNLGPVLDYLSRSAGMRVPSGVWPSAYRLAPRFLEAHEAPSFEDDLRWSVALGRRSS